MRIGEEGAGGEDKEKGSATNFSIPRREPFSLYRKEPMYDDSSEKIDLKALSLKHLQDALERGFLLVGGTIRELSTAQIIAVAKFIYTQDITSGKPSVETNAPEELFS